MHSIYKVYENHTCACTCAHTPRRIKEYLPRVLHRLHTSATGGDMSQDQHHRQNGRPGSVYDSSGDVGAGGLSYPS